MYLLKKKNSTGLIIDDGTRITSIKNISVGHKIFFEQYCNIGNTNFKKLA